MYICIKKSNNRHSTRRVEKNGEIDGVIGVALNFHAATSLALNPWKKNLRSSPPVNFYETKRFSR